MTDYENDGLGETLDLHAQVIGMQAMRVLESAMQRMRESKEDQRRESEAATRDAQARYESHAMLARKDLDPVMGEGFWKDADLDKIREKYVTARAFAEGDERFQGYRDRIEERAAALHDQTPDTLLQGPVPAGPQPMTDEQLTRFVNEVAPEWYRVWAQEQVAANDRIKDEVEQANAHGKHAGVVREDMTLWRDAKVLSPNVLAVQEAWERGDIGGWKHRKVDLTERFDSLTVDERRAYGWREGGPKVQGPLSVDDARLLASTTAPGWYRVQDLVASDLPPALREKYETRLVEDMTALRSTGHLDTASAREEWARFTGHPMSAATQDENESLADFHTRRNEAFNLNWASTEADRDHIAAPHGPEVGKPMSVAEAETFAEKYAPDWLRERHGALMVEATNHQDPDRIAYEQTNLREQFRYAMEEARDTGALSHQYAQALRSNAHFNKLDESEGMRHVPSGERVAFGGPVARPMSDAEALEVMEGWAPDWYKDQVKRTLREGNELSDMAKRSTLDAVRGDMTGVRDRGVLNTDHAKRLWASSQPGFDPSDPDSRKAVDRRDQLWVETTGRREGPFPMDKNNRERFGGSAELTTQPIPVVRPEQVRDATVAPSPQEAPEAARSRANDPGEGDWEVAPIPGRERAAGRSEADPQTVAMDQVRAERRGPAYDSVDRREAEARKARKAGHPPDAVDAMLAENYSHPTKKAGGTMRPDNFEDVRARSAQLHQRPTNGPKLGR